MIIRKSPEVIAARQRRDAAVVIVGAAAAAVALWAGFGLRGGSGDADQAAAIEPTPSTEPVQLLVTETPSGTPSPTATPTPQPSAATVQTSSATSDPINGTIRQVVGTVYDVAAPARAFVASGSGIVTVMVTVTSPASVTVNGQQTVVESEATLQTAIADGERTEIVVAALESVPLQFTAVVAAPSGR